MRKAGRRTGSDVSGLGQSEVVGKRSRGIDHLKEAGGRYKVDKLAGCRV